MITTDDQDDVYSPNLKFPPKESYRYSRLPKEQLEKIIVMKQSQLDNIIKESIMHGDHLSGQPFIPEYLGFEEEIAEMADGSTQRVYRKQDRILFRYPSYKDEYKHIWMVDFRTEINLPNMLIAITVLGSLGFDVSVKKYVETGGC